MEFKAENLTRRLTYRISFIQEQQSILKKQIESPKASLEYSMKRKQQFNELCSRLIEIKNLAEHFGFEVRELEHEPYTF